MNEDLLMLKRLEALRAQHRELDDQIDAGILDEFTCKRMKVTRSRVRDEIFKIEQVVYPDITA